MKKLFIFANIIVLILYFQIALAQPLYWQQTNGPYGGYISDIVVLNDTLIGGGIGGVYLSVDNAKNWRCLGLQNFTVKSICVVTGTIFAGTSYKGIYRSTNYGREWHKINNGLPYYVSVSGIVFKDSLLFIGTADNGIYKSTNMGLMWNAANNGINNYSIRGIYLGNKSIVASAAGTSGSGIFYSTNNGDNWARVDPNPYAWDASSIYYYKEILYAAPFGNYAKVKKSIDDGVTWNTPNYSTAPRDILTSIFVNPTGIYVGTYFYGIYKSQNDGNSWISVNNGLQNQNIFTLTGNDKKLIAVSHDGIYMSVNAGANWIQNNHGLTNSIIYSLTSYDNNIFVGTFGGGIYRSNNSGNDWKKLNIGDNKPYIYDIISIGKEIYAIAANEWYDAFTGRVFLSTDDGNTWVSRSNGFDSGLLTSITGNNATLFVGTQVGIFKSTDKGLVWSRKSNGFNGQPNISSITCLSSIVIASDGMSSIYRSIDNGENWSVVQIDPRGMPPVNKVEVIGNKIFVGCSQVNFIYVSIDSGATWQKTNSPLYNASVNDFSGDKENIYAALSGGGGILHSSNGGFNWYEMNDNLPNKNVRSVLSTKTRVYAGTYGSSIFRLVMQSDLPDIVLLKSPPDDSKDQPLKINFEWYNSQNAQYYHLQLSKDSLFEILFFDDSMVVSQHYLIDSLKFSTKYYWRVRGINSFGNGDFSSTFKFTTDSARASDIIQNYPNPFNNSTVFKFYLGKISFVNLKIYNILGEEVESLINETMAPGIYQINWIPINLSNGVYFYRIKTDNIVKIRKLILLK